MQIFRRIKNIIELISLPYFLRCGRTDKVVNSSEKVLALYLRYNPKYDYIKTINYIYPEDIIILSSCIVDDSFNARDFYFYREYKYYFSKNINIQKM